MMIRLKNSGIGLWVMKRQRIRLILRVRFWIGQGLSPNLELIFSFTALATVAQRIKSRRAYQFYVLRKNPFPIRSIRQIRARLAKSVSPTGPIPVSSKLRKLKHSLHLLLQARQTLFRKGNQRQTNLTSTNTLQFQSRLHTRRITLYI